MGRLVKRLLPRKELKGRKLIQTFDEYNYPTESTVTFTFKDCGVQPVTGQKQFVVPEGYRDNKVYTVFTSTPAFPRVEGSNDRYQIEVKTGIWCDIVDSDEWGYGVQSHYKLIVAEVNER